MRRAISQSRRQAHREIVHTHLSLAAGPAIGRQGIWHSWLWHQRFLVDAVLAAAVPRRNLTTSSKIRSAKSSLDIKGNSSGEGLPRSKITTALFSESKPEPS